MKRVAILYSEYTPVIDAIIYQLKDFQVDCLNFLDENNTSYDLVVLIGNEQCYAGNALTCHYSLLPAFESDEPVKAAMLSGVKVTGITVYYTKSKNIVAQYPIFIRQEAHFEEVEQELKYIEQIIFPIVIEKVLKNEIIDLRSILQKDKSCSGCHGGGCSTCKN